MSDNSCCIDPESSKSRVLYWTVCLADMPRTLRAAVKEGADVSIVEGGFSLLMNALWRSRFENAKTLIDLGADVHFVGHDGGTALQIAALRGDEKLVRLLLKKGARKEDKDATGDNALAHAIFSGHKHLIKLLS